MVTEIMSNEFGKASCPRDASFKPVSQKMSVSKRRKAREKFLCFCDIVLSYTKYEQKKQQEQEEIRARSQLDSDGSAADSLSEESNSSSLFMDDDSDSQMFPSQHYKGSSNVKERVDGQLPTGDESSETVTCFCLKPFGGRPMIECSRCNTWIHLSCAKIRRTNIPDVYICQACKDAKTKKRKSGRMRLEKQRLDM